MNTHLIWFRRDLRCADHAALYQALKDAIRLDHVVVGVFVFDITILQGLPYQDRRLTFIWESLHSLKQLLQGYGIALQIVYGNPIEVIPRLAKGLQVAAVYANHDDEPASLSRDKLVLEQLIGLNVPFYTYKDHVIFERSEIMTHQHQPYSVFTPYKNAWLKRFLASADAFYSRAYPSEDYAKRYGARGKRPLALAGFNLPSNLVDTINFVDSLAAIGFDGNYRMASPAGVQGGQTLLNDFLKRMANYHTNRDFPAIKGPSYLSVHLRFGTVSVRQLVREALLLQPTEGAKTWLNELIWRDFYHQIMHHHPHAMTAAFKPAYDAIQWAQGTQADEHFAAWCQGKTGYPLVDAAQRQLNQTGYMHNRLRMVSACFLIKDLGIDWRRGEAYFARHLNDFDLAANNGGWQWAASSGCDAQPYFRIFNPTLQSQTFDDQGNFIRRYVPELAHLNAKDIHTPWLKLNLNLNLNSNKSGFAFKPNQQDSQQPYPSPIVEHALARQATLTRYEVVRLDKLKIIKNN